MWLIDLVLIFDLPKHICVWSPETTIKKNGAELKSHTSRKTNVLGHEDCESQTFNLRKENSGAGHLPER